MTQRFTLLNNQRGFTIIEVMVGALILVVGILGVTTMANTANVESSTAKARVGATNLAREFLENAREFDYEQLSGQIPAVGTNTALETAMTGVGLGDANLSANGWQVTRRGISYTITVFTCVMDDAHDGARATVAVGNTDSNSAGNYCLGSAAAGSTARADANPDDYRKVEVSVRWTFGGIAPVVNCKNAAQDTLGGATGGTGRACVTQSALIANPAGGLGPAVKSLTQDPAGAGAVVSGQTSVTMKVVTAGKAGSVTWTADDGQRGSATAWPGNTDGTEWQFTWTFTADAPEDGSHTVSAQAFLLTAGGVSKETSILFNRVVPDAILGSLDGGIDRRLAIPTGNPAAVLNWAQSLDNDVFGYTVYRAAGTTPDPTTDEPVCSTTSLSDKLCIDAVSNLAAEARDEATMPGWCPTADPGYDPADLCLAYYVVPFDTLAGAPDTSYDSADCPSMTWSSVNVPAPPVPASRSIAPITGSPSWANARAGCPSPFIQINFTDGNTRTPPDPPTPATPTCTTSSDGLAVINWTPPAAGDQYRIYRDPGSDPPAYDAAATTIDFTGISSFTDPVSTGNTGHRYYVTVVDSAYAESDELRIDWSPGGCP